MAVSLEVGSVPNFDCHGEAATVGTRWSRWLKAFNFYIDGKGVKDNEQKVALLLHSAGMDTQDIFDTLDEVPFVSQGDGDTDNVYKQAVRKLYSYFTPKTNIPYERHIFRSMKQQENETVDQLLPD
jgi:hypothetical protein